ncbi:hypothetical protein ANCCAN_01979 [Ancylostoma caninum]|uniref:Cysteine rich repeat-containing domain protein n=1 Tax=Ancylostoma caninum TaxID=29170 RepID=A0A368H5L7_ANCCA|nr:hypothetical protein ANCCAN_01979 [Ancylostoma caninum]
MFTTPQMYTTPGYLPTTTMAPITYPPMTYQPVTATTTMYQPPYFEENPCQQCMGACMNECSAAGQTPQQCQQACDQNCAPACGQQPQTIPQIYEPYPQDQCSQCQQSCLQQCQQQGGQSCELQCNQQCQTVCQSQYVLTVNVPVSASSPNCMPQCQQTCNTQCVQQNSVRSVKKTPVLSPRQSISIPGIAMRARMHQLMRTVVPDDDRRLPAAGLAVCLPYQLQSLRRIHVLPS